MIIFLILLGLAIIGLVLFLLTFKFWIDNYRLAWFSLLLFGAAITGTVITGLIALSTRVTSCSSTYQKYANTYELMTYRIEEDEANYITYYDEIRDYNRAITRAAEYADNPWIGWYFNPRLKELPLITFPSE